MIKNIIFDFDGTLVDSLSGIEISVREAIKNVFPNKKISNLRSLIGPPVEEVFASLLGEVEPILLARLVDEFRNHYDSMGFKKTVPFNQVEDTLKLLKENGVNSLIATNKPIKATIAILEWLALDQLFIDVISRDSEPFFNSKTEITAFLLEKHDLNHKNTLYVGDSIDDALAAQALGLKFLYAQYGYGLINDKFEGKSIDSFDQVAKFL